MTDNSENGRREKIELRDFVQHVKAVPRWGTRKGETVQLQLVPLDIRDHGAFIQNPTGGKPIEWMIGFCGGVAFIAVVARWPMDLPGGVSMAIGLSASCLFLLLMRNQNLLFLLTLSLVCFLGSALIWEGAFRFVPICERHLSKGEQRPKPTIIDKFCADENVIDALYLLKELGQPTGRDWLIAAGIAMGLGVLIFSLSRWGRR